MEQRSVHPRWTLPQARNKCTPLSQEEGGGLLTRMRRCPAKMQRKEREDRTKLKRVGRMRNWVSPILKAAAFRVPGLPPPADQSKILLANLGVKITILSKKLCFRA